MPKRNSGYQAVSDTMPVQPGSHAERGANGSTDSGGSTVQEQAQVLAQAFRLASRSVKGKTASRRRVRSNDELYMPGLGGQRKVPRQPGRDPRTLETIELLVNWDADASKSLWNFLRLGNTGHTVEVLDMQDNPMPEGEDYINQLAIRVWQDGGGGADTLAGALIQTYVKAGGAGLEVVPTDDLQEVDDIYPFTPADIEFVWMVDTVTGKLSLEMIPGRRVPGDTGALVPLSRLQTKYLPLDPPPNDPYGRSPMLPAVSTLLQLMKIVNDHLDIMYVQGVGRGDASVDSDKLAALVPHLKGAPGKETELMAFLQAAVDDANDQLNELDLTEWFAHLDTLTISSTAPAGRGAGLGIEPMLLFFGQRKSNALKTMPILLGEVEAVGTQATVQWQVEAHSISTIQDLVKRLLEAAYNTALRIRGIQGRVRLTFNSVRDTDRMIEAQADSIEYQNERNKFEDGIIDHQTFSDRTDGHDPMGPPPPTSREQFELQQEQASGNLFALASAGGGADTGNGQGGNDNQDVPDANQPGTDAGISAEEGALLDQAGQNSTQPRPTMISLLKEVVGTQAALTSFKEAGRMNNRLYRHSMRILASAYYWARANGTFDLRTELTRLGALPTEQGAGTGRREVTATDTSNTTELPLEALAVLGDDVLDRTREFLHDLSQDDLADLLDAEDEDEAATEAEAATDDEQ
jgi:hypothetical protein